MSFPYTHAEFYKINKLVTLAINNVIEDFGCKCLGFKRGSDLLIRVDRDDVKKFEYVDVIRDFCDWMDEASIGELEFGLFDSNKILKEIVDSYGTGVSTYVPLYRFTQYLRNTCYKILFELEKSLRINYRRIEDSQEYIDDWENVSNVL